MTRGDEEGTGDFIRLEAAERPQGKSHLRVLRKRRMAAGEDQSQAIVRDLGTITFVRLKDPRILRGERVRGQRLELSLQPSLASEAIDRSIARRLDDPRPRELRHARRPPRLQRGHERLLGDLFGKIEVTHLPDQGGDDAPPFGPVDLVHNLGDVVRSHGRC